jgi:hypothetical protein
MHKALCIHHIEKEKEKRRERKRERELCNKNKAKLCLRSLNQCKRHEVEIKDI